MSEDLHTQACVRLPTVHQRRLSEFEILLFEILSKGPDQLGFNDTEASRLVPAVLDQAARVDEESQHNSKWTRHIARSRKAAEIFRKVPRIDPKDAETQHNAANFMHTMEVLWDAMWWGVCFETVPLVSTVILCPGILSDRERKAMKDKMHEHTERLKEHPLSVLQNLLNQSDVSCDISVVRFILHAVVARSSMQELIDLCRYG